MNTYFRVTVLSLVGMMFVCFSNVVFSKQNIAVVVGEDILANDNSVLSSMIGKPQSVEQSRTRTRKTHEVEVNKDKDVVMVRNGTDALLLSFVFGENTEKVELNAESTAIALVLLHPSLLGTITDVQQALVPEIKSLASFNKLVNKVRSLVQQDSAPLDYWKHPALIIKVNDVVEELLSTVNFEVLLSSHLRKGTRAPNERVKRGDFVIDETAFEKGTLKITNPKAIYYSVYLDNNDVFGGEEEKNILEAKEGLATVDAKLFPPSLGLATTKESSFELATLNTNQLTDYKINLVQDFSNWNPNTPEGFATWFNMIKGLNLVLKTVGKSVTPKSKDDFDNWVKTYLPKIQKMQDFLNSKTFVNARLYAHGGVMFVGILYTHTYDPELKKTLGEWYHLLKNTLAFVEKSAELLKLAPLKPNEVEKQIDLWVKEIFHQYETYSDFLPALKKGDVFIEDISVIYEKIVVEIQKKISSGILSSDFPFTYEYGMKKIMGIFDAMETTELLMPLLQLVLNDFAKDSVKVIGELIFKSVFGAYYKVASLALVIGNEVVPYMYDMFDAPKKVSFTVHEGVLKTLPSPELSDLMISLQADGTVLYHYDNDSGVVYSDSKEEFVAQRGIEMEQGSCIDLEYEALMAGNFTRGVEAITEGEIDPDENQAVIHFLSRIFVPDSSSSHINGNYIAHILKIWDKKGFSFNKPDWKYIFLDTQSGILEGEDLDQDDAKWPSEISLSTGHSFKHHFGNDDSKDAITVSDSFCLPQDYVPSFLRIELRNFQSESEDLFHVKLRKPNQPPVLEEPYVEKDPNDFLKYRFYVSAMDDYTPSENLNVKVYINMPKKGLMKSCSLRLTMKDCLTVEESMCIPVALSQT